ncbi:MAG: hypothetical protein U1D30_20895 [Planctomycetota bacterium]
MPLLMLMLERVGIVTYEQLATGKEDGDAWQLHSGGFDHAGGDPNTMIFLALPMYALFELGLF